MWWTDVPSMKRTAPGPGAEHLRRLVGRVQHRRMVRQREVAVGVHPQELAVAALQPVARTARARGGHVADDDAFGRLGAAFALELGDLRDQAGVELVE